jgi:hypothetical protein
MDDHMKPANAAQKGAQKYFTKTGQDDALAKETRKKERTATAAKTARLRALRLAKEAADKEEADKLAAQKTDTPAPAPRKRVAAAKPVKFVRMSY